MPFARTYTRRDYESIIEGDTDVTNVLAMCYGSLKAENTL